MRPINSRFERVTGARHQYCYALFFYPPCCFTPQLLINGTGRQQRISAKQPAVNKESRNCAVYRGVLTKTFN